MGESPEVAADDPVDELPEHGVNTDAEMCGPWTDADPFAEDDDDRDD